MVALSTLAEIKSLLFLNHAKGIYLHKYPIALRLTQLISIDIQEPILIVWRPPTKRRSVIPRKQKGHAVIANRLNRQLAFANQDPPLLYVKKRKQTSCEHYHKVWVLWVLIRATRNIMLNRISILLLSSLDMQTRIDISTQR